MTEDRVTTKAELMAHIERDWNALQALINQYSAEQLINVRDANEWSAKDHIVNITAWEKSAVFFLQGKPRHEGLGVDEPLYMISPIDEINDVIFRQRKYQPLETALAELNSVHQRMLAMLEPMTDYHLNLPYNYYLPDESGDADDPGPPAINIIYGNTAHHYRQHIKWIKELLAPTGTTQR